MPRKIKIVLTLVAIVAVFSVYELAHYVHLAANGESAAILNSTNLQDTQNCPTCDPNHDGLTNAQDIIWGIDPLGPNKNSQGYVYGEEVAAGRNPITGELLPTIDSSSSANITDGLSTLMTSGMYAGALDPSNPTAYNNALADISSTVLDNGAQALDPSTLQLDSAITSSDSKADQEKYVNAIGSIIESDLWGEMVNEPTQVAAQVITLTNQPADTDAQNFFQTKADYYHNVLVKINSTPVPPSWNDIHQKLLTAIKGLEIDHQALGQIGNDPMKGMIAMSNLVSVYQNIPPILVSIAQKINDGHLNPPNSQLWSLINSLTNGL